jgi:hypothetical protein
MNEIGYNSKKNSANLRNTMRKNQIYKYLMACGHFCSDVNQGALAAVLPFLVAAYSYDYATAATLVLASNIAGSVIQPFIGHLADRKNMPWIVMAGLALAGGGMAVTGFARDFYAICAAVIVSGIGVAMFHPQAAKIINQASNERDRAKNIGVFSFGGNLGFTFGPILVTSSIATFGLKGMAVFILPQIAICAALAFYYKGLSALGKPQSKGSDKICAGDVSVADESKFEKNAGNEVATSKAQMNGKSAGKFGEKQTAVDDWWAFIRLCFAIFGRSIVFYGVNTFLALYWIDRLGASESAASLVLSVFFGIGAFSTLLGGFLADRYGYRRMIRFSFALTAPCIVALCLCENPYLAALFLLPLGASLGMSYSPMVVLAQLYLPNRVGLASGVTLGLAVSVGGIFAPMLGKIADNMGIVWAFYAVAAIALVPMVAAFMLPEVRNKNLSIF